VTFIHIESFPSPLALEETRLSGANAGSGRRHRPRRPGGGDLLVSAPDRLRQDRRLWRREWRRRCSATLQLCRRPVRAARPLVVAPTRELACAGRTRVDLALWPQPVPAFAPCGRRQWTRSASARALQGGVHIVVGHAPGACANHMERRALDCFGAGDRGPRRSR